MRRCPARASSPPTSRRSTRSCPPSSRTSTRAALETARAACDGPAQSGEQTLDFGGQQARGRPAQPHAPCSRASAGGRWTASTSSRRPTGRPSARRPTRPADTPRARRCWTRRPPLPGLPQGLDPGPAVIPEPLRALVRRRPAQRPARARAAGGRGRPGHRPHGGRHRQDAGRAARTQKGSHDMDSEPWCGAFAELRARRRPGSRQSAVGRGQLDGEQRHPRAS